MNAGFQSHVPSVCAVFARHFFLAYAGFGPATLEFEFEQWENSLLSNAQAHRATMRSTVALRSDGSRAVRHQFETFRYYLWPEQSGIIAGFIDAVRKVDVDLDVIKLQAVARPNRCPLPPLWRPAPRDCVLNDPFGATRLADTTHLGMRVAVWRLHGGTEQWLAPRLNCAVVREVTTEFGDWHFPVRYTRRELQRIHFGEPDAQLFVIPPSYRQHNW